MPAGAGVASAGEVCAAGGWADWRLHTGVSAGVCAGVSRCTAPGLYRCGDNKLSQVMCKLSGENFFFSYPSAQAANPIPVAAYAASKTGGNPQLSAERARNVEGDDNILR